MNRRSRNSNLLARWNSKQAIAFCVVLLLLVGYVYLRPVIEKNFGIKLPSLDNGPKTAQTSTTNSFPKISVPAANGSSNSASSGFILKEISKNRFETPAGLIYGPSREGNRIDHVMLHAVDDPDRPQQHGVFDVQDRDSVLQLVDRAFDFVKQNASNVNTSREGRRTVYTVDMGDRIGYVGGRVGQDRRNPPCQKIVLVLDDRNVITAYPAK